MNGDRDLCYGFEWSSLWTGVLVIVGWNVPLVRSRVSCVHFGGIINRRSLYTNTLLWLSEDSETGLGYNDSPQWSIGKALEF